MPAKAKVVCSTINIITNSLNSLRSDVAMAVLRPSLQPRLQYRQQTHRHDSLQDTNQVVQMALDKAATQISGFDPRSPDAYLKDPATFSDPRIMPGLIALPVRHKGLGLRRLDDFVGAAASIGDLYLVSRNRIGFTDDEESIYGSLYPLLGSALGANS